MRSRASRVLAPVIALAATAGLWLFLTLPPNPAAVDLGQAGAPAGGTTVAGAFHVHTTRSDGSASPDDVAHAAERAGLQFLIFSDHGDGTRSPDPPRYRGGVLTLDAVEISTAGGHYIAIGLPATPYPLGGEPEAVVEDVRRLGGFGVVAHPTSKKGDLRWGDPSLNVDGIEWLNADSQWRDESLLGLLPATAQYLLRPHAVLASLLDRPTEALAVWDDLAARRRTVGFAGSDAHGRGGQATTREGPSPWVIGFPDYDRLFRTFSQHVQLRQPWSGDPDGDAMLLLDALRDGRIFTVIDGIAGLAALSFEALTSGRTYNMGERVPPARIDAAPVELLATVALPHEGRIVLFADGRPVTESDGPELRHQADEPGVYRIEVHTVDAPGTPPIPWIVSNPIYVGASRTAPSASISRASTSTAALVEGGEGFDGVDWVVERDERSRGSVVTAAGNLTFRYQLGSPATSNLFAAAVRALDPNDLNQFDGVGFDVVATQPVRLSMQLRAGGGATGQRWIRSFYADHTTRRVTIAFDELKPVSGDGAESLPPRGRSGSDTLLFVVDLVNALPGSTAEVVLAKLALERW